MPIFFNADSNVTVIKQTCNQVHLCSNKYNHSGNKSNKWYCLSRQSILLQQSTNLMFPLDFFVMYNKQKDYNGCSGKLQCQHKFNSKTTAWHFIRLCIIYMQQRIEHILYFLKSIGKIANNTPCKGKKSINFLCHGNTLNVGNISIVCWM